mgnify:CR=1 FL=1
MQDRLLLRLVLIITIHWNHHVGARRAGEHHIGSTAVEVIAYIYHREKTDLWAIASSEVQIRSIGKDRPRQFC